MVRALSRSPSRDGRNRIGERTNPEVAAVIHEIWSTTRPTFKRLRFRPGLNIVSVRRTEEASTTGKRNAAGKSSLIDIVHFLFGGNREAGSPLSAPELAEDAFKMKCDIAGGSVAVSRSNSEPRQIQIEGDYTNWPVAPDVDDKGAVTFSNDQWCDMLGRAMFGLPPAQNIGSGGFLSFRSCFSYFVRRQRTGGYLDWRRYFIQERPVQWQVVLAYLFGLDREGPVSLYRIKEADRQKSQLEKLLKTEFAAIAMPSAARLRINARKLERQLTRLENQLTGFHVVDFYDDLLEEANTLQQSIDQLTNANVLDDELARDIRAALESENPPGLPDLQQLYKEAGVVLRDQVLKRYDQVEEFHRAVVLNRREHLTSELEDARARIKQRSHDAARQSERRNEILATLSTGGALVQYRKLDNQLHTVRGDLDTVRRQLALAERIDAMRADLKVQRAEAERRIKQDLKERSAL